MQQVVKLAQARHIIPVVLCGGSGTRLWPASRKSRPKQFLPLCGRHSAFQETILRVTGDQFARPVVVTNSDHRFLAADQLRTIGVEADILLEPEGRESGPAFAAGAAYAVERDGETAIVLGLAADHVVRDIEGFHKACAAALEGALAGRIVTFGIAPQHPATNFGYLQPGDTITDSVRAITRFVEKPDAATAARYLDEGFLWNSGNFLCRAAEFLAEYEAADPETVAAVRAAVANRVADLDFLRLESEAFGQARKLSVDYAVMEVTTKAATTSATFDWVDIGSWSAVRDLTPQDEAGNAADGSALFVNARNSFVSTEGPLVAVVGVDDLAVVVTGDAILVAKRDDAAGVKAAVEKLKGANPNLTEDHLQSFRPWGDFRSLDQGERYQVKRITVKPGGRLSLQSHHHRSEHWIVVRGTARVTVNGNIDTLHENESIYIPAGAVHRLENPGKITLELIEVQTGSYLGEDDIIRVEDVYNRIAS